MRATQLRLHYEIQHRLPYRIRSTTVPDKDLHDIVGQYQTPGCALDLGCGSGRNSLFLASKGWDVTGVELIGKPLRLARRNAAAAGVPLRLVHGDASQLARCGVGTGFDLIVDAGCYHAIALEQRDAYAAQVTEVAAPGALMHMVAFAEQNTPGMNVTMDDLCTRYAGWEILSAAAMPLQEMLDYSAGPKFAKRILTSGRFQPWRYRMRRLTGSG